LAEPTVDPWSHNWDETPRAKFYPAKWAVLGMLLLGVAASVFAVWFYAHQQRRPLGYWGPAEAQVIMKASKVEVLRLTKNKGPAMAGRERIEAEGEHWDVLMARDISTAADLDAFRLDLLRDSSFSWDETTSCEPAYNYAMRFQDKGKTATVLFSFDCPKAYLVGKDHSVGIDPSVERWQPFLEELFLGK
jgi:hypothetical protein